jgi:MEMO1 family protein
VAGLFYPADPAVLSSTIERLLEAAPSHYIPRLRGLVCPHAGYEFSGRTAATAYKTLAGREIQTVVLLAPSHYALLQGASISDVDGYRTPLGVVPLSEKAKALSGVAPFVLEPKCPVQRPGWWQQAPKPAPEEGQDTPDTWEHSAEVQVPFLQKTLKNFKLLPVVFGRVDPEQVARVLAGQLDAESIVVASSDLSHYHPYAEAQTLDGRCVKAICALDVEAMKTQEACGQGPVLALMHLAQLKGWKAQLLDCRNSGDATGDKSRVVGYSAIAFFEPLAESLNDKERQALLELARRSLTSAAAAGPVPALPAKDLTPKLKETKACFVTLTLNGALRGCIGHILPQEPLARAVSDNAASAAVRDPRFRPVAPEEVAKLRIEISVLTEPAALAFSSPEDLLKKLRPYEDGVVLQMGSRSATFLPQVWAQIPDKTEFLNHLAEKAGCPASAWRGQGTSVAIYHVESFEEPEDLRPRDE